MENVCDQCAKPAQADGDNIRCMGFCNQIAHVMCAKMNSSFLKILRERKNLFWMCDECVKLMKMTRFKEAMSSVSCAVSSTQDRHAEALSELKQAIKANGEHVEKLSKKVIETASTPLSSRNEAREPPKKRRREEQTKTNPPLLVRTKSSSSQTIMTVSPPKELFWLYLSRIHPSVKTEAIVELAKESLQCNEPIKVIPLLKRNADLSTMNFISFKVGMDKKYRDIALDVETWPRGVVFREFDGTNAKNFWAPQIQEKTQNAPRIEVTPTSDLLPPSTEVGSSQMETS
ncbi:uncharacterized protein LOC129718196 [Wyeomyia smithii]|uniref:uncharacterized protein LOC129718196 n=1 Tax=Wyeomyia smithii TaxID=174621 RepID=UPI0024681DC2|nr:uncharacterized protein LOC129718196 [Wyeomyia smithii]